MGSEVESKNPLFTIAFIFHIEFPMHTKMNISGHLKWAQTFWIFLDFSSLKIQHDFLLFFLSIAIVMGLFSENTEKSLSTLIT